MEHVDRLPELRHVDHPERLTSTDPDFVHAESDRERHLPVRRFLALLDFPQLEAGLATYFVGKLPQPIPAIAEPRNWFNVHDIKSDIIVNLDLMLRAF